MISNLKQYVKKYKLQNKLGVLLTKPYSFLFNQGLTVFSFLFSDGPLY